MTSTTDTTTTTQSLCEFSGCEKAATTIRSLMGERPYGLCDAHVTEDAQILGLGEDTLAETDEPLATGPYYAWVEIDLAESGRAPEDVTEQVSDAIAGGRDLDEVAAEMAAYDADNTAWVRAPHQIIYRLGHLLGDGSEQIVATGSWTADRDAHRAEQIDAIAALISGNEMTAEAIAAANADGWTIDVRYSDHEYISDSDWTQTSELTLSDAELAQAIELARARYYYA